MRRQPAPVDATREDDCGFGGGSTGSLLITGQGDVVQPTDVENVSVITSGPLPPNPAELLGNQKMLDFLAEAGRKFDRVIVDTPPVVAVTDACTIAGSVDGVIQVVASSKTSRRILERGKGQLQKVGANFLGEWVTAQTNYFHKLKRQAP